MLEFLKKKKQKAAPLDEEAIRKQQDDFLAEHKYKMEHTPNTENPLKKVPLSLRQTEKHRKSRTC